MRDFTPRKALTFIPRPMTKTNTPKKKKTRTNATAETMAAGQRDISVSEFFAKNRHLLGFDNPRKAMLTAIKEAVDNALDACEEAGILPHIYVRVLQVNETRFKLTIRDNGPGIVREQIENIFGKLLYGSKFHRLKMSRGQQGIGISAAGMYGLMTTGKPVVIISKIKRKKAHEVVLKMDTTKNRPSVISDTEHAEDDKLFAEGHGTQVTIELEGKYQKGRQSIDEYLEQTAIANPHAQITYATPTNETIEFPRVIDELPEEPKEIKPHPKGIELGTLIQMLERTDQRQLGGFLTKDFCRVGATKAREIAKGADLTGQSWVKTIGHTEAEKLYDSIQKTRIIAPNTDCLVPIGSKALLAGLLKEVKAEFFAASTRPPNVYRGNPFQIEVAIGYGGGLGRDDSAKVLRFANRVPLLYSQSSCCSFKAVAETSWKNYGLTQPRNSIPSGPLVVMVHMVSVWVPFTSESKEAIADYDEIRKEMKLALQECGRKLGTYLRRRKRMARESERRSVFERYIGEISRCCNSLVGADTDKLYKALLKQAKRRTDEADAELDDEGNIIDDGGRLGNDDDVIIVDDLQDLPEQEDTLFGKSAKKKKKKITKKKRGKK